MAKAFVVQIKAADEPLVRRLGAAVVKVWDQLSEPDRALILDQANLADDPKNQTVQLREQFESLIKEKRVG